MNSAVIGAIVLALIVFAVLIAVSAAIFSTKLRERSRSEAFQAFAEELDLVYEAKAPRDFRDAWAVLPQIPKQGDVHHLIYGSHEGVPITVFRHRYVVSTGQTTAVIVHWVFSTEVPDWPEIHVKPRGFLARAFGGRSKIVDDEHFDRQWVIKAKDRAFARAFLSPNTRELIASARTDGKKVKETWHVVGGKLCCVVRANLDQAGVREELRRLHLLLDTLAGQRVLREAMLL